MNAKSLSPKVKHYAKKSKIVLKKLTSLTTLSPPKPNESMASVYSPDSHASLVTSNMNSQLYSSRISLKLGSNQSSGLTFAKQHKLRAIAQKFAPVKAAKSIPSNIGEHLLPLSSSEVISVFSSVLTKYEIQELNDYEEVYYLGLKAKKIQLFEKLLKQDFDDKETDYILVVGDHIAYQYEIIETLGSGSFAQVCKCWDHKNSKEIALKIIKSHKRFNDQALVEVKVLAYIRKHDKSQNSQFVKMLDSFTFRKHQCIVFELHSFNLYDLLKANDFRGFSSTLVRRFALQILTAMVFLKKHRIIHCDLKPENIILAAPNESTIKIIDFGSSCFEREKIYFYIQSRIYRAPEIILGVMYSAGIDMWSFGCIISEMITGTPLFLGENEADQLSSIMEALGYPPPELMDFAEKKHKFFGADGSLKHVKNSRGIERVPGSKSLEEKIRSNDLQYVDFIKRKC